MSTKNIKSLNQIIYICLAINSFAVFYLSVIPLYNQKNLLGSNEAIEYFNLSKLFSADFLANCMIFIPIGAAFAALALLNSKRAPLYFGLSLTFALCLSLISESTQLFINFRVLSLNDIFAQATGCFIGFLGSYAILGASLEPSLKLIKSSLFKNFLYFQPSKFFNLCALLIYSGLAIIIYSDPSFEVLSKEEISTKLYGYLQLPFSLMLRGSYLDALENILFSACLLLPLGFYLFMPLNKISKHFALFFGVSLSISLELVQAFFSGHYSDISSSLVLFAGFLLGCALAQGLGFISDAELTNEESTATLPIKAL